MRSLLLVALFILSMFNTFAQAINSCKTGTFDMHCLVREPRKPIEHPPAIFLLHGVGSNEKDLFSFAGQLPDDWLVVSVRAPYTVSDGHYKWYDVKMVDEKITIDFSQEEVSRKRVIKFIDAVVSSYHADSSRIVVAGFSQGANMASLVSLTAPEKVTGFAIFSGRFIEEIKPLISTSTSLRSLKCFLAHGNKDYMLPMAYARENQLALQRLGIPVTFSEDAVAHSVSQKFFEDFLSWLNQYYR